MQYTHEKYKERLAELFERHPSVGSAGFSSQAYKPGLEGMLKFAERLGYPEKKFKSIHVAGTNGKGTVCSMLAAALAANGYKTGLYTSPHLVDFRERAKIIQKDNFKMISETEVWDFLEQNDLDDLSFFEITTGIAFSWFAAQNVDFAVIETGLGGRLDSTNILTPSLSIITSIGLDHCAQLGDTKASIAAEKAGIFKKGIPAIVGKREDETAEVFERIAAEIGAPLYFADDYSLPNIPSELQRPCLSENLRTACLALSLIEEKAELNAISHYAEITGLRGRWEKLPGLPETICDIGHNTDALKINFARLEAMQRPLFIVFGIMADKDINSILPLLPKKAKYFCTAPDTPRALPAKELSELMSAYNRICCDSVAGAVSKAREEAVQNNGLVYVGGSNYVVSECIIFLEA